MNETGYIKKKRLLTSRRIMILLGVTVPILNFLLIWCQINGRYLLQAFQMEGVNGQTTWTLLNFKSFFDSLSNPYSPITESLLNTLKIFAWNLLVETPLCFLFSFFIYKKIWCYKFFRWVFFMPSIISGVVLAGVVKAFAGVTGPLPAIWETLFGVRPLFFQNEQYAFKFLLMYSLWSGFGINLLYFMSAMARIPQEVLESARLDGCSIWREVIHITVPLIWPTLSTILLLKFTGIWGSDVSVLLFTQGEYGTSTINYWIYGNTKIGNYNAVSAIGLILTVVSLPIVVLVRFLANRVESVEY